MKKSLATITTVAAYLTLALPAFAQVSVNPCPSGQGGGSNFSVLCGLNASKFGTVLSEVITIVLIAAAIIALFFLILGGIRWITSGGDKAKVESARNTIIASIIGLIIALLAFFIITIVLGFFGLSLANLTLPKIG
jgi:uncharacterized protein YacL